MSATFTDGNGREWKLRLTTDQLSVLRDRFKLDVVGMTDFGQFIGLLFDDPERFVSVVHLLARPPADMTAEDFASGFDGPTLEAAGVALLEAFANFSPRSRIAQWRTTKIRELMTAFDEQLIRSAESSGGVTNSPGSSG